MTRKKSNVKALALAVTCAILAGGGIGLEPVYAANVNYDTGSKKLQTGVATFTDINTLTVGNVIIHGIKGSNGEPYGITIGDDTDGTGHHVMISNHDISATGAVHAAIISTGFSRMESGKLVAQSGLYIGTTDLNDPKYENSKFAVYGSNGSFKAAGGAFNVSDSGAITADSLTLGTDYNVKQNIEDAKNRINTVEGNVTTNQNNITTLTGRVDAHDTNIDELQKKTKGIARGTDGNSTKVEGVNFKEGAVSGVTSINDNLKFESDGIYLNKGDQTKQIKIDNDGKIIIGTSSSAYDTNGFYAGGDDYDAAKAGIKSDGSLKATGFTVDGATGNTTVGGTLTVAGEATFAKETAFGNGIKTDTISENNEGKGVTVDGVLLKDKGITAAGDNFTVNGLTGDVTTKGALKGKTLGIGGTDNDKFIVDEDGAVKAAGGKVEIDKTGKATFGEVANNRTTIAGKLATFGENTTTDYTTINGGNLDTYDLTVRNDMTVNNFKAKNITSEERITVGATANEVYLDANGTLSLGLEENQKLERTQLANINDTIKSGKVIDATSATIGNVAINGGDVTTATGTITGKTITDGNGFTATGGKITALEGKIGNVEIKAGVVTGVNRIEAQAFKVDDDNYLNSTGIKANSITAKGGTIGGAVINETTLAVGNTKLDTESITTHQLKIRDMSLTDARLNTGDNKFEVNGVEFKQGQVTAKASEGFVAGTSYFKQDSLIVDANNKLEKTQGLTTEKATVKGALDVTGQATFGTAGNQTTINGQTVTTDILKANKLILGASGDKTVEVDKDGSLKAADGAFTVANDGKTTFKKDDNNLTSINGGNIWAKATDIADNTSSELTHDYKGLHIKGNKSGQKSAFDFDTASGIGTFTGQDNSTTKINGSAIRSEKIDGTAGKLDGENLTLYKDPNNQTTMSAGKATFTGDAGEKGGKVTTINGGTISTDTLNVERINLGEDILDSNGNPHGSNLSMDKQGNFSAAGGNFKVTGGSGADKGAFTNTVGNTTLQTDNAGASMKFDNTAADGGVESKVTVEANKATVAAGDKASFVATTDNGGTATITGGTQTVTTTGNGTVFENSANNTAFVTDGATNTIINGNEITTGKITTDELVITGKGDAAGPGTGSLAFGGNGTIKSDVKKDGSTNNTQFTTDINGVNTMVTDGQTTTENKVTAAGNSNTVTKDEKHKSEFNQGLTSIGGVVTNGEIKVAQKLDGEHGLLINEVKDDKGSSKLEQSSTGLTYTDSANTGNETRIDSGDVSIGAALDKDGNQLVDDGKEGINRINLSDLGQIDNLDDELKNRPEYKNGEEVGTAVGAINAEAGIRREEVARLDNRIDDVNNRVDKVGAMAAAIASLKSIGYDPQAPSEFSIGLGQYKGETGVAMGFFHYPNKNFMINVSLSTAGGETMGGIGATWRFGHKSPQKLLEEQREAQAKKELAAAEKYQAAAKLAKEAQERAEYAAKLARQAQVSADNAKAAADATQAKHFG